MQQIRLYGEAFITLPKRMLSDTCNLQVAEHFIGINSRMPKNPVTVDKHRPKTRSQTKNEKASTYQGDANKTQEDDPDLTENEDKLADNIETEEKPHKADSNADHGKIVNPQIHEGNNSSNPLYPQFDDGDQEYLKSSNKLDNQTARNRFQNSTAEFVETNSQPTIWILFTIFVLIVAILLGLVALGRVSNSNFLSSNKPRIDFKAQKLANLSILLNSSEISQYMPVFGRKILMRAFEEALDDNAKSPVALLLMASPSQRKLVHDIVHQIVNLVEAEPSIFEIKPSCDEKTIETIFSKTFIEQQRRCLILESVEKLEGSVAMVLHQFTDNENSIIKNSFIIMTLEYTHEYLVDSKISMKKIGEISSEELRRLWSSAHNNDNLDCLINRVAERTVVLQTVPSMSN